MNEKLNTNFLFSQEFVVEFSHAGPCVLTRSLLQITFIPENHRVYGHLPFTEVLKESLRSFAAPPILSHHYSSLQNNPQAKELIDVFLQRASRVLLFDVFLFLRKYSCDSSYNRKFFVNFLHLPNKILSKHNNLQY